MKKKICLISDFILILLAYLICYTYSKKVWPCACVFSIVRARLSMKMKINMLLSDDLPRING